MMRVGGVRARRKAGGAAVLVLVMLLAGCAGDVESWSDMAAYRQQQLDWQDCEQGFECAKLTVPLDYDRPGWKQIELAVTRRPADKPGQRVGSLLVNPGGPGASGVRFARSASNVLSSAVLARFDVVGFDPRGVAGSAPVQCLPDSKLDTYLAQDMSPDDSGERGELERLSKGFADGCARRSKELLPHVGTANAARDMDVLRAALGEDRLNYLGLSYGTLLGATYAELFPDKVRALVLDGALDPQQTPVEQAVAQARGFETALRSFLEDCVSRSACPFTSRNAEGAMDRLEKFLEAVDEEPLPARGQQGGQRELTQSLAVYGIAAALYDTESWRYLRIALQGALSGDGGPLLRLADQLNGRNADGSYNNMLEANLAINCVGAGIPGKVSAYADAAERAGSEAPHFGEFVAWGTLPCAYWPVRADSELSIDARGAAPILVIGTTRDPATPYEWSEALASQLASGVLLTRKGDGHTAYGQGNACIDSAVDRYLIQGKPPPAGKVCS